MPDQDEYDYDDEDDTKVPTEEELATYATGVVTKQTLEIYEKYAEILGKNEALGITLEAQANAIGNMISLVSDDTQEEVIESVIKVIRQSLSIQMQLVDEMRYGVVGHA